MGKYVISCPSCGGKALQAFDNTHFLCKSCGTQFSLQGGKETVHHVHEHHVTQHVVGNELEVENLIKLADEAFLKGNYQESVGYAKEVLIRDAGNIMATTIVEMPFCVLGSKLSYDQVKEICDTLKLSTGYEDDPFVFKAREMLRGYTGCRRDKKLMDVLKDWFTFGFPEPFMKKKKSGKIIAFLIVTLLLGAGVALFFVLR